MRALLVILAMLVAVPASAQSTKTIKVLSVTTFVAQGLDLHSTHLALSRGAFEGNTRIASWPFKTQVAVKLGAATAIVWAANKVRGKEDQRLAVFILAAASIAPSIVAYQNYRLAHRLGG